MSVSTVLGKNVQDWAVQYKTHTIAPGPRGQVWFVDSSNGNSADGSTNGQDPDFPFATLQFAFQHLDAITGPARDNLGDVIVVGSNHAETIDSAADLDCDVAGVSVIGQGWGEDRPTFTFATDTAADLDIDAANITIYNCIFRCNIASQVLMFDVNAAGFRLLNCLIEEGTATGISFIDLAGAGADCIIEGNQILAPTAGNYDEAIHINSTLDGLIIRDNYIRGDFDDAAIHNPTSNVATNLIIEGNTVINLQSGAHAMELVSASTGFFRNNAFISDAAATSVDPGSLVDGGGNSFATTGADGAASPLLTSGSYIQGLGTRVVKTTVDATAAADDVFTVTGKVLINLIHGEVTTAVAGGTTPSFKLNTKTTSADICALTTMTADTTGTLYLITGDQDDTANGADAPQVSLAQIGDANGLAPVIVNGEVIEMTTTGTATAGVMTWECYYQPLEAGATVVASA